MSDLKGRAILVTGGAQGIGKGLVRFFLEGGARVAFLDADADAAAETAEELRGAGERLAIVGDVADERDVGRAVKETVNRFGGLDGLVNNAGIAKASGAPVAELERAAWDRLLAVNLTGPLLCAKHAVPHLRAARGAIVNIASTRALQSEPNSEAYAASKGGLVALTHALAISLGPEVRVNCISPGWIETGPWQKRDRRREPHHSETDRSQHPCGRVGTVEDVAELAAYLLSPRSGFVTGQNLVVDGGMTRKMIYV